MVPSRIRCTATRLCKAVAVATLFVALGLTSAHAQWEWIYGVGGTNEGGRRGVLPVRSDVCGNVPGYVSVGWSDVNGNFDVYLVRTDCNGRPVFETTVDVTGAGDMDFARSIAPTLDCKGRITGYVVTGFTNYTGPGSNGTSDLFIVKVDCRFRVVWSRTYGRSDQSEGGHDIIVARTGDGKTTNIGDIVVAGWAHEPAGGNPQRLTDGYILRTTENGFIITDVALDNGTNTTGPTDEIFMALTELTPSATTLPGDFMVVGSTTANNGPHSWATRVTHVLTVLPGPPPWSGTFGDPGSSFFSVIELQNPAEIGANGLRNVVAVGDNGNGDIMAVKMDGGDPRCAPGTVEKIIAQGFDREAAYDVKEVEFIPQGSILSQWDLVMTGWVDEINTANPADAFFLATTPNLNVLFGTTLSANSLNGFEQGWSIHPDNVSCAQSMVICGITTAYDQSDLYLVRTNVVGRTGCEGGYAPIDIDVSNCQLTRPRALRIGRHLDQCPVARRQSMGAQVCPLPTPTPGTAKPTPQLSDNAPSRTGDHASVAPNPVIAGMPLSVSTKAAKPVSLTVSNSVGEVVARYDALEADASGEITIPTVGLLPGTYGVTLDEGTNRSATRFVVY